MKKNFLIKTAEPKDLDEVYALNQEFAKLYDAEDQLTLSKDRFKKDFGLFECRIATIDNDIVGFSTFFPAYYTWVGKCLYLDDLFVTQSHRNQGIGELLLDDVIAIAQESNYKRVIWQVSDWNKKAQKFYQAKNAVLVTGEINCIYEIEPNRKF